MQYYAKASFIHSTASTQHQLCAGPGGAGLGHVGHLLASHLEEASERILWGAGHTLPSSFRSPSLTPHPPAPRARAAA